MSLSAHLLAGDKHLLDHLRGKRFLITGGSGMLGGAFRAQLKQLVPSAEVHSLGKDALDVRNTAAFQSYLSIRPDYVLHCAALVDADYCESHPDDGHASIVGGTLNTLNFAQKCGAKLLYPQSFLIHDGAEFPITEQTIPQPLGVYGRLKLQAEQAVTDSLVSSLVVRMGGFFGGGPADDNFVGRMTPHLAKLIKQGAAAIDIGNRVWQPTYTHDIAANSLLLLAAERSGVYCMASHGSASFYDLTLEIARIIGVSERIAIGQVDAGLLAAKESARRPVSAVMQNVRLNHEDLDRQRPWQISLAEYLDQPFFKDMFI